MLDQDTQPLTNAPSKQNLHTDCARVCHRFGFQHFLFISKTSNSTQPRLIIIQGTSANTSDTRREESRGVMRISARTNSSDLEISKILSQFPSDHKQQFTNVLQSKQVKIPLMNSLSFPVTGKNGDIGMLILASSVDLCHLNTTKEQLSYTQEFAQNIHQVAMHLVDKKSTVDRQKLTQRESECLRWAAIGKTNWEIGEILGISKRTVLFHLHNAGKKLQTSNRYHTLARAVSLGLT